MLHDVSGHLLDAQRDLVHHRLRNAAFLAEGIDAAGHLHDLLDAVADGHGELVLLPAAEIRREHEEPLRKTLPPISPEKDKYEDRCKRQRLRDRKGQPHAGRAQRPDEEDRNDDGIEQRLHDGQENGKRRMPRRLIKPADDERRRPQRQGNGKASERNAAHCGGLRIPQAQQRGKAAREDPQQNRRESGNDQRVPQGGAQTALESAAVLFSVEHPRHRGDRHGSAEGQRADEVLCLSPHIHHRDGAYAHGRQQMIEDHRPEQIAAGVHHDGQRQSEHLPVGGSGFLRPEQAEEAVLLPEMEKQHRKSQPVADRGGKRDSEHAPAKEKHHHEVDDHIRCGHDQYGRHRQLHGAVDLHEGGKRGIQYHGDRAQQETPQVMHRVVRKLSFRAEKRRQLRGKNQAEAGNHKADGRAEEDHHGKQIPHLVDRSPSKGAGGQDASARIAHHADGRKEKADGRNDAHGPELADAQELPDNDIINELAQHHRQRCEDGGHHKGAVCAPDQIVVIHLSPPCLPVCPSGAILFRSRIKRSSTRFVN